MYDELTGHVHWHIEIHMDSATTKSGMKAGHESSMCALYTSAPYLCT